VFYAVKISRDFTYVGLLIFITVGSLLGYITNNDRTIGASYQISLDQKVIRLDNNRRLITLDIRA